MGLNRYKGPLIVGGVIVFALLVLSQVAVQLIDKDHILEQISLQVETLTGQPLVTGDVSVGLLSGPKLEINGMAIRNASETKQTYLIEADKLIISFGFSGLISGNPSVSGVVLQGAKIHLERDTRGRSNWWFIQQVDKDVSAMESFDVDLKGSSIHYENHQTQVRYDINDIRGSLSARFDQIAFRGRARLLDKELSASATCRLNRFNALASFDADCSADASGDGLTINATNRMIMQRDTTQSRGSVNVETTDIRFWGDAFFSQTDQALEKYFTESLPVKFELESYSDNRQSIINVTSLSVGQTIGKASVHLKEQQGQSDLQINAGFQMLDYDSLAGLIDQSAGGKTDLFAIDGGFDRAMGGNLKLQTNQMRYNGLSLQNVQVDGEFVGGELAINNAQAKLPGEGSLVTLGSLASSVEGMQYDGLIEASGASLAELTPLLGFEPSAAIRKDFTTYRARMNVTMTRESTILSELRLIAGDRIRIAGGLNSYSDPSRPMTGTIGIENFDFAPLENEWLGEFSLLDNPAQLPADNPYAFQWLQDVKKPMALRFELKNYSLMGLSGKNSVVVFQLEPNQLKLDQINATLDGSRIRGSIAVKRDAMMARPFINSQLNISRLNLKNAIRENIWSPGNEPGSGIDNSVWSKQPINLYVLHHSDGFHEWRIGRIQHEKFSASGFRAKLEVQDYALSASDMRFNIWGGSFSGKLQLDAKVVPSMALEFKMENGRFSDILESFVDFKNISGLVSIAGSFQMNGVNFSTWIQNLRGTLSLDARNIFVRHFNLPAIVRSISSVRAVSGLSNAIRLAFDNGSTQFGSVNGVMYFDKGLMDTTRVNIQSNESVGKMEGHFDLRSWTSHVRFNIGLIALTQVNYPFLSVIFSGPLEMPKRQLDLKSIESYLSQKLR